MKRRWVVLAGDVRQVTNDLNYYDVKFDGFYGLSWTPDGRIVYASAASGNQDIWVMQSDGTYKRRSGGGPDFSAQQYFMEAPGTKKLLPPEREG